MIDYTEFDEKVDAAVADKIAGREVTLARFSQAERDLLARRGLNDLIRDAVRHQTHLAELDAEAQACNRPERNEPSKQDDTASPLWKMPDAPHGTARIAARTPCDCQKCEDWRADDAESKRRWSMEVLSIIKRHSTDLKIEWTAELLSSPFALADGTLVTWGSATVEHHAERVEMFQRNAEANIDGAARHQAAISHLKSAGASCLDELTPVPTATHRGSLTLQRPIG